MAATILIKRDTSINWFNNNPILRSGEFGLETDTRKIKIGNGQRWNSISKFITPTENTLESLLVNYVLSSEKGVVNGVASLDSSGKIPLSQLPDALSLDSELAAAASLSANDATSKANAAKIAAETAAKAYADTLATNYDPAGSANAAETAAKAYADTLATNYDPAGSANAAETASKAYTDEIATDLLNNVGDSLGDYIPLNKFGTPSGVATLDSNGILNLTQVPSSIATKAYADSSAATAVSEVIGSAPAALNTLNELASALANDSSYATTINNALSLKAPIDSPTFTGEVTLPEDTISQSMMKVNSIGTDEIIPFSIDSINIAANAIIESKIASGAVTSSKIANNTIMNIDISPSAEISMLKISGLTSQLDSKAPIANPTFTGTVSGITKNMVGLEFVDNVPDLSKPLSNETRAALSTKLDSETAAITYSTIDSPTFTGTVSGVTKSHVGLANVDNTSDANKPISTATQTALDTKINKIIEVNPQPGSYSIIASDAFKLIEMSGGGTLTITDSVSFPTGTTIEVLQTTDSQVTIAGSGFTPNSTPGLKLRARWSSATLLKRGTNSWVVMGDLSA
jgi:hypothetical protein